ncbi:hypothetical protein FRB90_011699 [Tulasnella sp. 427]|nr:hypothetical protein FRB90_011699 [Tulasnella sp. 427]
MTPQPSSSRNQFDIEPLTSIQQAHGQLERRRLFSRRPATPFYITPTFVKSNQLHTRDDESLGQPTIPDAMSYAPKSLEIIKTALLALEKQSDTALYHDNQSPAASENTASKTLQTLCPMKDAGVARETVNQHMARVIDFARVIRTTSDFAFVGHTACKAALRHVRLLSTGEEVFDRGKISRIRAELSGIYQQSTQLIQAAMAVRKSIGELKFSARRTRNEIARHHSDSPKTMVAVKPTSEIQKFFMITSAVPLGFVLASFVYGAASQVASSVIQTTTGVGTLLGIIQTFLNLRLSGLKKGDTEYVKKAYELFNQLVSNLEKLESVVSGYEGMLSEMWALLTTPIPEDRMLAVHSVAVWESIEERFRALNEQGDAARDFLDHHRLTSDEAPSLIDLTGGAGSATLLGL